MSYNNMGPRYVGGGQIFPNQSQNQMPFNQLQQQIKAMQMHMQQQMGQKSGPMQNQSPIKKKPQDENISDLKNNENKTNNSMNNSQNQSSKINESQKLEGKHDSKPANQELNSAKPQNPQTPVGIKHPFEIKKEKASPKIPSLMEQPPPPIMSNNSMDRKPRGPPNQPPNDGQSFNRPGYNKQDGPNNYNRNQSAMDMLKQEQTSNFNNRPALKDGIKQEEPEFFNRNRGFNDQGYYEGNMYNNRKPNRPSGSGGMNMPPGRSDNSWGYHGRGGMQPYGKGHFGHDKIKEKVQQAFSDPLAELEAWDTSEKKFNVNNKLFVANLPKGTVQEELEARFKVYGELGPIFINKESSFAFITLDTRENAVKAQKSLDNTAFKNRTLKVRFSTLSEGIQLENLSPNVSNELLQKTFSAFGTVDTCRVNVDERGMSKGEAVIIFREKKSAIQAIKKCQEECLFLSGALRPVIVSPLEPTDETEEGLPESHLIKNEDYRSERSVAPHFADEGSFENDFGLQWKQLYHMYKEKKLTLERDFKLEIDRLEKKMVLARVEYETDKLRKELAAREADAAQLRRRFGDDIETPQFPPSDYEFSAKRPPMDQGYDAAFSDPYDSQYGSSRSSNYERDYRDYDRAGYETFGDMRDRNYPPAGNYSRDNSFSRPGMAQGYDEPPHQPERSIGQPPPPPQGLGISPDKSFDMGPERGFDQSFDGPGGNPTPDDFNSAPKRPRY